MPPRRATHAPQALLPAPLRLAAAAFGLAGLLSLAAPALALTPAEIEAGNRAAQRVQNEQQERLQQQLREDAQRKGQAQEQEVQAPQAPSLPKSGTCRDIKEIVLLGVTLLPEAERARLTAPYLNRCLYAEDIEKLLADVLKAYIDRGFVAVRPYVQPQDLSRGRLEILIVEGRVEGIRLKDKTWRGGNLATAFPALEGKPLNLRDIEQGLDQLNRLASRRHDGNYDGVVLAAELPRLPILEVAVFRRYWACTKRCVS